MTQTDKKLGDFHKRLSDVVHCETGFNKIYFETAIDIVDEAKEEFQEVFRKNLSWEDEAPQLESLIKKWFGDVDR